MSSRISTGDGRLRGPRDLPTHGLPSSPDPHLGSWGKRISGPPGRSGRWGSAGCGLRQGPTRPPTVSPDGPLGPLGLTHPGQTGKDPLGENQRSQRDLWCLPLPNYRGSEGVRTLPWGLGVSERDGYLAKRTSCPPGESGSYVQRLTPVVRFRCVTTLSGVASLSSPRSPLLPPSFPTYPPRVS